MEHLIINIGRQLGSGGRSVAAILAAHYGINVYDRELLSRASTESGLGEDLFEKSDERAFRLFRRSPIALLSKGFNSFGSESPLSGDALFKIQSDVIRKIADEESCIFIGRCADYVLRDRTDCVNIFLSASVEDRVQRLCQNDGLTPDEAMSRIEKGDRKRADYYNHFSDRTWGAAPTYHLCLDTSLLGIDESAQFAIQFIDRFQAQQNR